MLLRATRQSHLGARPSPGNQNATQWSLGALVGPNFGHPWTLEMSGTADDARPAFRDFQGSNSVTQRGSKASDLEAQPLA